MIMKMPKQTKQTKQLKKKAVEKKHKKIKILAAGDIHGDVRQVEKLARQAEKEKVNIVLLTGDITMAEQSTDYLIGPFVKRDIEVLLIPGNHETLATANFLADVYGPNVKNIHGYAAMIGDIGIFGCGGTVDKGLIGPKFTLTEKEIFKLLKQGFEKVKGAKKKIMVTHVHPSHSLIQKVSPILKGSDAVVKAIKKFKPDYALCSHVHEAEGLSEKINKTQVISIGKKGRILEFIV